MNPKLLRPLAAEFVGTAMFVFVGAAAAVLNNPLTNNIGALGVAFAQGTALAIAVSATLNISGGHLNPAVTFAIALAKKIDWKSAGYYVLAQLAGAVIGAGAVKALLPGPVVRALSAGVPVIATSITIVQAMWIEAALTFVLVSVVFGTAVSKDAPKIAGFGIGAAVFGCVLAAGSLTGAAMNPARAFGPAAVSWEFHGQAAYWLGPAIGAAAAGLVWRFVLLPRDLTEV